MHDLVFRAGRHHARLRRLGLSLKRISIVDLGAERVA